MAVTIIVITGTLQLHESLNEGLWVIIDTV